MSINCYQLTLVHILLCINAVNLIVFIYVATINIDHSEYNFTITFFVFIFLAFNALSTLLNAFQAINAYQQYCRSEFCAQNNNILTQILNISYRVISIHIRYEYSSCKNIKLNFFFLFLFYFIIFSLGIFQRCQYRYIDPEYI